MIAEIFSVLDELRSQGVTILLVEQDARLALKHADRGYVMRTGRIALEGTATELLADENVRQIYLGSWRGEGERVIWNPEYECMDRSALHELQLRRLQMTVSWVYERVPYYRDRLDELGVKPRDIRVSTTSRKLPFTDKIALRDTYPFGMFALPLEEVVRVHSSSGTTGKPIVVGYSRGDINTWTELTARVAAAAGVHRGDLVQMAFLYGMFTGGWGMHYGIERIGATIIPAGSGRPSATS